VKISNAKMAYVVIVSLNALLLHCQQLLEMLSNNDFRIVPATHSEEQPKKATEVEAVTLLGMGLLGTGQPGNA
jgi:hypothetical protein